MEGTQTFDELVAQETHGHRRLTHASISKNHLRGGARPKFRCGGIRFGGKARRRKRTKGGERRERGGRKRKGSYDAEKHHLSMTPSLSLLEFFIFFYIIIIRSKLYPTTAEMCGMLSLRATVAENIHEGMVRSEPLARYRRTGSTIRVLPCLGSHLYVSDHIRAYKHTTRCRPTTYRSSLKPGPLMRSARTSVRSCSRARQNLFRGRRISQSPNSQTNQNQTMEFQSVAVMECGWNVNQETQARPMA